MHLQAVYHTSCKISCFLSIIIIVFFTSIKFLILTSLILFQEADSNVKNFDSNSLYSFRCFRLLFYVYIFIFQVNFLLHITVWYMVLQISNNLLFIFHTLKIFQFWSPFFEFNLLVKHIAVNDEDSNYRKLVIKNVKIKTSSPFSQIF